MGALTGSTFFKILLCFISLNDDPTHRLAQIDNGDIGCGFQPFRIPIPKKNRAAPGATPGFDVAPAVSYHEACRQGYSLALGGAKDHAGLRFATRTKIDVIVFTHLRRS